MHPHVSKSFKLLNGVGTSQSSSYLTQQQHLTKLITHFSLKRISYLASRTPGSPGFHSLFLLLISLCWFLLNCPGSKYWSISRNGLWDSFLTTFTPQVISFSFTNLITIYVEVYGLLCICIYLYMYRHTHFQICNFSAYLFS